MPLLRSRTSMSRARRSLLDQEPDDAALSAGKSWSQPCASSKGRVKSSKSFSELGRLPSTISQRPEDSPAFLLLEKPQ
jgi:hypothetical protein